MSATTTIKREKVFIDPALTTAEIKEKYQLPYKKAWVAKKRLLRQKLYEAPGDD